MPPILRKDEGERLALAFLFIVRNETFEVNRAALAIKGELDKGFDQSDHPVLWEAVYGILAHSANLSKVFWPSSRKSSCVERGKMMRQAFEVTEASPLFERRVRNGFEHLDERVHAWLADADTSRIIDQWIGCTSMFQAFQGRHIWRSFFVDTGVVNVGNDSIDLFPLLAENDRLYLKWRELEGKGPHPEIVVAP